jgi:hypothetical protein
MTRSSLSGAFWILGHDDHRPAGTKQGTFGNVRFRGVRLGFDLADDCKIVPPRNPTKPIDRTGKARAERQRFGRNARERSRLGKPLDRFLRQACFLGFQSFDNFGGSLAIAHQWID